MIDVRCDSCSQELHSPGGLLFAVPDELGDCRKFHLCPRCTQDVLDTFRLRSNMPAPRKDTP